jgi:hypothetical protein
MEYANVTDVYGSLVLSACSLKKDFSEITDAYEKYLKYSDKYVDASAAADDKLVHSPTYLQVNPSNYVMIAYCTRCIDGSEFALAAKVIKRMQKPSKDINFGDNKIYIQTKFIVMYELNDYSDLPEFIETVLTSNAPEDVHLFFYRSLLAQITLMRKPAENISSNTTVNTETIELTADSNKPEYIFDAKVTRGDYIKKVKESIEAQKEGTVQEDFRALITALDKFYNHGGMTDKEIAELFSGIEKITPVCSDIFPLLALFGHNLDVIADKLDDEIIYDLPERIVIYGGIIADIIIDYTSKIVLEKISPRQQLLLLNLCLSILYSLKEDSKFDPETIANIISTISACYLETVYKPDIIDETNIEHMILPLQLGFYLFLSKISLVDGDLIGSLRYQRKLLSLEPRLKEYINRQTKNKPNE